MSHWLRVAALVARNDLRREVRTGQAWVTMLLFALIVVVVFGFLWGDIGGGGSHVLVAGILWITIPFAALVAFGRSFAAEREDDRLLGLAMVPVDRSAVFGGKLAGNLVVVLALEAAFLPLSSIFLGYDLAGIWLSLVPVLLLGTLGLSAVGTLLAAIVSHLRQGEAFLAVLMLPVAIPILASAVESTAILMAGDPLSDARTFLLFSLAFDLLILGVAALVFDALMEE